MKRPLLMVRFGRRYDRREGFVLVIILAPWPESEQEVGGLCRALMNLRVDFRPRWPFVGFDCEFSDAAERPA